MNEARNDGERSLRPHNFPLTWRLDDDLTGEFMIWAAKRGFEGLHPLVISSRRSNLCCTGDEDSERLPEAREMGLDFVKLETGNALHINLALLQAALRLIIHDRLREPPFGVGANEYATLRYLVQTNSAIAVPDICSYLAISRASARQVVKRLSDLGLIASSREPGDKRRRTWRATDHGSSIATLPISDIDPDLPLIRSLNALSADERSTLNSELRTLVFTMASRSGENGQTGAKSENREAERLPLAAFVALLDLWLKTARAYRRIRAEQSGYLMQASGGLLDTAAYMTLYRVHEGPTNMNGISGFLRVDQNTASRIVNRLLRAALVSRNHNPSSRREMLITPTEKGTTLLESISGLDPSGDYIESLDRLEHSGASLANLLQRIVSGHSSALIYNSEFLRNLIRRVVAKQSVSEESDADRNFRRAMSEFLTGAAVISVKDEKGPQGIAVKSLSPVSFDPPILVVCAERRSPLVETMQNVGTFGMSILSSEQAQAWETRESAPKAGDVFVEMAGVPLVRQSRASLVCDVDHVLNDESLTLIFCAPRRIANVA